MATAVHRSRRPRLTLIHLLLGLGLLGVAIGLLLPLVSRVPRERYQGRDQFQWAAALQSGDAAARRQAAAALCEIMRRHPSKQGVRWVVSDALSEAGAVEAVPALEEMRLSGDEDLRRVAEVTLERLRADARK
jgi:hypothetical protein